MGLVAVCTGHLKMSRPPEGPRSGSSKYGPSGTPQTPSVWPKSSGALSMPTQVATSKRPNTPIVELSMKRNADVMP